MEEGKALTADEYGRIVQNLSMASRGFFDKEQQFKVCQEGCNYIYFLVRELEKRGVDFGFDKE